MAGQANSLISHGSLVGTIKTSNAATNSLVGRLNVDNTITGRMDTSSLTGALDTDNAITSQSGSISTDDQMIGVLNANNTIAGGVCTAYNPAYALADEAAAQIVLYINNTDYKFYAELKDKNGSHIANSNIIDLPLESMVVNGSYDSTNKEIVLTLNNGNTLRFSVADLVSGLVSTTDLSTVLLNYVEFTDYANGTNAGVIKTSSSYATETSDGVLRAQNKTYAQYESLSNNAFIGKGTLDNAITGKELTNKTYVDNADKVFEDDLFNSGYVINEGTDISLDTKLGKPEIELKGNTIQNEVPTPDNPVPVNVVSGGQEIDVVGKNLFDCYKYPSTVSTGGITITNNGDGSFTLNGTATAEATFTLGSAKTIKDYCNTQDMTHTAYYVSGSIQKVSTSATRTVIRLNYNLSGSMIQLSTLNSTHTKESKTQTQTTTSGWAWQIILGVGDVCDNFTIKYQLEKGSIVSEYEEYKKQSYEIDLGKNLFNKDNVVENKRLDSSGQLYSDNSYITSQYIVVSPSTDYTYSRNDTGGGSSAICYYKQDKTFISRNMWGGGFESRTITTPNEAFYVRVCDKKNLDIQFEKGSQATSYSAYKTPIELCKINDYQDKIYKDNDKWYLEKNIFLFDKDNLDDFTVNKRNDGDGTNTITFNIKYTDMTLTGSQNYMCNCFQRSQTSISGIEGYGSAVSEKVVYLQVNRSRLSSLDVNGFKSYYKENNVKIYCPMDTPTTTEITDSELISQLEEIELFNGLNNILTSSSGDLPGIIKIKAFSNTTAGSITRLEKIVEFLGDSIGDIGTLLDEIQGEVI